MRRRSILLAVLSSVTAFAFADARCAELTVSITDVRGRPVADAVVIATLKDAAAPPAAAGTTAVMDQLNKAFVPAVLVVRRGTSVVFPNSDSIAHQVYSFSPAKRFELGLYRGHPHPPVLLEQSGLIVLGCNIHDGMVGYIYVTDSPHFGKSDARGVWQATALPLGSYEVSIWSPRLPRAANAAKRQVTLTGAAAGRVDLQLSHALQTEAPGASDTRIRDY
jgi:plastocyanin